MSDNPRTFGFRPGGLITVWLRLGGLSGSQVVLVALDTGASMTVVRPEVLASIGYDLTQPVRGAMIATASRSETVPVFRVGSANALGMSREGMSIAALELPTASGIKGLLGLDFLSNSQLTLDFRRGILVVRD